MEIKIQKKVAINEIRLIRDPNNVWWIEVNSMEVGGMPILRKKLSKRFMEALKEELFGDEVLEIDGKKPRKRTR